MLIVKQNTNKCKSSRRKMWLTIYRKQKYYIFKKINLHSIHSFGSLTRWFSLFLYLCARTLSHFRSLFLSLFLSLNSVERDSRHKIQFVIRLHRFFSRNCRGYCWEKRIIESHTIESHSSVAGRQNKNTHVSRLEISTQRPSCHNHHIHTHWISISIPHVFQIYLYCTRIIIYSL